MTITFKCFALSQVQVIALRQNSATEATHQTLQVAVVGIEEHIRASHGGNLVTSTASSTNWLTVLCVTLKRAQKQCWFSTQQGFDASRKSAQQRCLRSGHSTVFVPLAHAFRPLFRVIARVYDVIFRHVINAGFRERSLISDCRDRLLSARRRLNVER